MIRAVFDTRRFQTAMKRFPSRLSKEMGIALNQHGFAFKAAMARRKPFRTGTGNLLRSQGHEVFGNSIKDLRLRLFIGGGVAGRYARIQELGGVVRGKPWLTIPLPDNLTAAGIPRFKSAKALQGTGRTFLTKSKAGNLIIGMRPEGGGNVRWLWILKRSVKLKPRLGFVDTFNSKVMRADRVKRFRAALKRTIRKGKL